jgi:ProP effector
MHGPPNSPRTDANDVIDLLAERFPACFARYEARRKPLKVGIKADILAALGGAITERELSIALRIYTSNEVYRRRLVEGAARIDLKGEPAGAVTPEQARRWEPKPQTKAAPAPKQASQAKAMKPAKVPKIAPSNTIAATTKAKPAPKIAPAKPKAATTITAMKKARRAARLERLRQFGGMAK